MVLSSKSSSRNKIYLSWQQVLATLLCELKRPCSSAEAREAYWDELKEAITQKYQDWDVILMGDLNCRLGGEPSQAVGHFQAEDSNGKEHQCHDFLLAKGIQLPSTFAEFQVGQPGTWLHPNGQWLRNDFVGIPQRWRPVVCKSWVEQDIDLALKKTDHCVAALALQLVFPIYHTRRKEVNRLHECDLEHLDGSFFWNLPQIEADWSMDVHTHAEVIQQNIYQSLLEFKKRKKKIKSSPRKTTLSEGTWDLVCQKKKARTYVTDLSRQQRTTLLAFCFCAWAGPDSNDLQNFGTILADQDRLIAVDSANSGGWGEKSLVQSAEITPISTMASLRKLPFSWTHNNPRNFGRSYVDPSLNCKPDV